MILHTIYLQRQPVSAIRLDPSTGANDDVTISGTTGQTAMTRISTSELRVSFNQTM